MKTPVTISRMALAAALLVALAPAVHAQDPYLDIVMDGTRALSTTVQGRQGLTPNAATNAAKAEANTRAGYELVQNYLQEGSLDLARVQEINGALRQGISSNGEVGGGGLRQSKGALRDFLMPMADDYGSTRIAYPDPKAVPGEAAKLDAFLQKVSARSLTRAQAIRAAADAHAFITQNHLFADGNGRTARMVSDWILMKNGLPPADYSALPSGEYIPDRRLSPKESRAKFRDYMERAVTASEARVAALGPEARARLGSRGRSTQSEVVPVQEGTGKPGAPRDTEIELLGQRSGAAYTRPLVGIGTMAGGYYAGAIAQQAARGQKIDLWQPVANLGTTEGACGLVAGTGGFIVGEYLAATALSSLIPVPGVGRLLGKPLAQAAIRSTVGAAAGYGLGSAATSQAIDWTDLAGSAVASGVGMAVGSLCFPPVGTIVGGIAGQVAWDLASGWLRSDRKKEETPDLGLE